MGYSSRYHVASLAAVFLALAVGILIGTGLSGVVSDTTKSLESTLRGRIDAAESRSNDLSRELDREHAFEDLAWQGLVKNLLLHQRIAVISLGGDPGVADAITQVVGSDGPAGSEVADTLTIAEPPDPSALVAALKGVRIGGRAVHNLAGDDELQTAIARRVGRSLVTGGRFYKKVRDTVVSKQSGSSANIDAVIVARQQPASLDPAQADATDRMEGGILDGLRAVGLPVVGVENSDTEPTSVPLYSEHQIASVDDLDLYSGRVALAYTLRGVPGGYGIKSTADDLMPELRAPRPPHPQGRAGKRP